ncbi:hypothetical protein [Mycoplasmopsis lipofaciens]|uniref:hypothetical protein n=1 Tax=Mycoplasmopsis lipofaciens TaxID=114884 RepID=UPI00047FE8EB|nr:hypothetical protein [Mycoplasmopsis lipofaciens]
MIKIKDKLNFYLPYSNLQQRIKVRKNDIINDLDFLLVVSIYKFRDKHLTMNFFDLLNKLYSWNEKWKPFLAQRLNCLIQNNTLVIEDKLKNSNLELLDNLVGDINLNKRIKYWFDNQKFFKLSENEEILNEKYEIVLFWGLKKEVNSFSELGWKYKKDNNNEFLNQSIEIFNKIKNDSLSVEWCKELVNDYELKFQNNFEEQKKDSAIVEISSKFDDNMSFISKNIDFELVLENEKQNIWELKILNSKLYDKLLEMTEIYNDYIYNMLSFSLSELNFLNKNDNEDLISNKNNDYIPFYEYFKSKDELEKNAKKILDHLKLENKSYLDDDFYEINNNIFIKIKIFNKETTFITKGITKIDSKDFINENIKQIILSNFFQKFKEKQLKNFVGEFKKFLKSEELYNESFFDICKSISNKYIDENAFFNSINVDSFLTLLNKIDNNEFFNNNIQIIQKFIDAKKIKPNNINEFYWKNNLNKLLESFAFNIDMFNDKNKFSKNWNYVFSNFLSKYNEINEIEKSLSLMISDNDKNNDTTIWKKLLSIREKYSDFSNKSPLFKSKTIEDKIASLNEKYLDNINIDNKILKRQNDAKALEIRQKLELSLNSNRNITLEQAINNSNIKKTDKNKLHKIRQFLNSIVHLVKNDSKDYECLVENKKQLIKISKQIDEYSTFINELISEVKNES